MLCIYHSVMDLQVFLYALYRVSVFILLNLVQLGGSWISPLSFVVVPSSCNLCCVNMLLYLIYKSHKREEEQEKSILRIVSTRFHRVFAVLRRRKNYAYIYQYSRPIHISKIKNRFFSCSFHAFSSGFDCFKRTEKIWPIFVNIFNLFPT